MNTLSSLACLINRAAVDVDGVISSMCDADAGNG